MRNLSSNWKEKVKSGMDVQYLKYADITLTDGTVLNLTSADLWANGFSFEDSVSNDSSFDIGSAIINVLNLSINNFDGEYSDYDFEGAEVICYVGMEFDDGTTEKIRICTATVVEQPEDETVTIDLTCEDNMRKFDRNYSDSKLNYPATRGQIIKDACEVCGVTLQTTSFDRDDYIVQTRPSDDALTFRQVLQWVAQIGCQWLRCDEYGRLCVKWYDTEKIDAQEIDTTYSFTPQHTDVVITGIQVTEYSDSSDEEPESYMVGTQGYVMAISDNKLIRKGDGQTVASMIAEKCVGMVFRPFESECPTDVALEAGDAITIEDRNGNLYSTYLTTTTFQPGAGQNIACNAKSAAKNSSTRYSQITQVYVTARKMVKAEKTAREKALEEFGKRIDSATGVYTTVEPQENGSKIFYLHDKPTLAESKAIWKMTSEAWGVSTDGGQTWNGGMTVDGDTIVRILNAVGVNATWINTGAITVKDANENILFQVDMDTKTVVIDPDVLIIGNMTLSEKLENMDENIASAKNMTFQLSNDMQTIASDADGNITVFPTVATTAKVMYGSNDITNDCSYTVTKSESVTGSWDVNTHTYTVTDLSADNGWVDIKATYLVNLSITKRFTVSKQKQGTDGKPGRTYIIEPSCNVLKRGSDKVISPNFITFKAYYRDGDSAARVPYKGRFVVEETVDGSTWKTIYASSTDEDTVTHYLYSILTNSSGQAVASSNGSTIGIPRDVTNVRCKLYASGGTTTLMDMQSVAVVIDVDNLTQSQIVEILSNDGAWKGLYYKNGQLYISFSAALGGELTLGGVNNGNGVQKIFNEKGVLSEKISNGGAIYYNDNGKATAIIKEGDIYAFYGTGVELSDTAQKVSGICFNGYGMYAFMGTVKESSNNTVHFTQDYIRVPYEDEYGQTWWVDPIRIEFNDDMSNYDATFCAEYLNVYKRARFDVAPEFSTRALGISSSASALGIEGEYPYETMVVLSSSSKRYKDLGDSITPEELKNWYNIEPLWAKYKDGYLVEGDENEGRYIPMFIAEDIEEYFPEATRHQNGQVEDWNERIMIPAMFAMIKSQKSEIDLLKQELNEIKQLLRKE